MRLICLQRSAATARGRNARGRFRMRPPTTLWWEHRPSGSGLTGARFSAWQAEAVRASVSAESSRVNSRLINVCGSCLYCSLERHSIGWQRISSNKSGSRLFCVFITSTAGAVAKYCNEHVCVCVCLAASIFPEPHARFLQTFVHVAHIAVAWSSYGGVTKSQGKRAILGVFFPTDDVVYI